MNMLKNFTAIVLVMLVQASEVQAQGFGLLPGPWSPPPAPVMLFGPRVVVTQSAPVFFNPGIIINDEIWKKTVFNDVYYSLNGEQFYVNESGDHFRMGERASTLVNHRFMEPYSQSQGVRIQKPVSSPFLTGTPSYQEGPKTIFINENGEEFFPTWVSSGSHTPIQQIWVKRGKSSSMGVIERLPTPVESFPAEKWEPVLPSLEKKNFQDGPALPAPPSPTLPKELKETTDSPVVASESVVRN